MGPHIPRRHRFAVLLDASLSLLAFRLAQRKGIANTLLALGALALVFAHFWNVLEGFEGGPKIE